MPSTGAERGPASDEEQPLLGHHTKLRFPSLNLQHWYSHSHSREQWTLQNTKQKVAEFLSSKYGHYSVLTLVSLDVLSMIAGKLGSANVFPTQLIQTDFILKLFKCEQEKSGADWDLALDVLGSMSLVFSCLFMLELIASVWAFGWGYFKSWFHRFDAFIVVAGFIIDVVLVGIIEEIASLIVVMRLWRVTKIVEELSLGSQEQTEDLKCEMDELREENEMLKKEISRLRTTEEGASP
ncbi:Voltage-gated hydrogen channel 1 [Ilyonectria robusta]